MSRVHNSETWYNNNVANVRFDIVSLVIGSRQPMTSVDKLIQEVEKVVQYIMKGGGVDVEGPVES